MRQETRRRERTAMPSMGQTLAASALLVLTALVLPLILPLGEPLYRPIGEEPQTQEEGKLPIDRVVQTAAAKDKGRPVRLLTKDEAVETLTMEEYLWGVVAAEMPAAFELEALKAQACAARTYTVMLQNAPKHGQADVCGDSACCQAYTGREAALARWGLEGPAYEEKIARAVEETDGLGVLYGGQPIQALFFSSAAGKTVDAVEVWGSAVDYLKSVDSPEGDEVPNYRAAVTLTAAQVRELTLAAYPGAAFSDDPAAWFGDVRRNGVGLVTSLTLGGVTLTGRQVRGLFSLRSANFTVAWDGEHFTFSTVGYGHGVGMSQYGANAMARAGSDFRAILTWYYTGTQVDGLW